MSVELLRHRLRCTSPTHAITKTSREEAQAWLDEIERLRAALQRIVTAYDDSDDGDMLALATAMMGIARAELQQSVVPATLPVGTCGECSRFETPTCPHLSREADAEGCVAFARATAMKGVRQ